MNFVLHQSVLWLRTLLHGVLHKVRTVPGCSPAAHPKRVQRPAVGAMILWAGVASSLFSMLPAAAANTSQKKGPDQIIADFKAKPIASITDEDVKRLADNPDVATKVTELILGGSAITVKSLDLFPRFKALEKVDLSSHPLPDRDWASLSKAVQIKWLSIAQSSITNETIAAIAPLVELRYLNLTNSKLTDAAFLHFEKLSKLEEILVSGNPITGNGFAALGPKGAKAKLKIIRAGNSQFGLFGPGHIKTMNSIEVLEAGKVEFSDQSLQGLKGLKNLKRLILSNNDKITDGGLKLLTGMKVLEELDLSTNKFVSNETLKRLKTFKQLKSVNVDLTSCTEAGVQALKKSLPDCEIRFNGTKY